MRIILLGAPGAGKGTQAKFILDKYGIKHISTGDLLRSRMMALAPSSQHAIMAAGKLVTDDLVIKLVKDRLQRDDCCHGFMLDGFPRTLRQAEALKESGITVDLVLEFVVPDQVIIDRIVGRKVHAPSGRIYHVKFHPPKEPDHDDLTGERLITRQDDKPETIYRRIAEYHQQTAPLIAYYRKEANAGHTSYFAINGTSTIAEVSAELVSILGATAKASSVSYHKTTN